MLRALGNWLLISSFALSVSALDVKFPHCHCDDEGLWTLESIFKCQKVSDLLIALAYFSIPIELVYFVTCSSLPFKWVLGQFIAFIVLCGLTHLCNAWIYEPHSFQLMLALTIFKFLTALVSCATSITLLTMIPLLLRVKVRELFLKLKTRELDREVGIMKKQEEASWHVRMLTHEIRKSLDKHTILYTTLIELSRILALQNCAVWMESEDHSRMILTYELKPRNPVSSYDLSISISDPDVLEIKGNKGVKILRPDSALAVASSDGTLDSNSVAAIRMPMLRVTNFKGGTPEIMPECYSILVLVLPGVDQRVWSHQAMEIVEVVADQVAVALSHAAVLEDSQMMREKLAEQNRMLQHARRNVMMASQAKNSFQKVMSQGMRRPMHSILGLLSMLQQENMDPDQRVIIDTVAKTSNVISTLINDVMDTVDRGRLSLDVRFFRLHSMIKEVGSLARCMCVCKGFDFEIDVDKRIPDRVIGDEKRIFQVILHTVGNLLNRADSGSVIFRVVVENGSDVLKDHRCFPWRAMASEGNVYVRFEIGINNAPSEESMLLEQLPGRHLSKSLEEDLSFEVCKKLVQMMQGIIWAAPNPEGLTDTMIVRLRFQLQPPTPNQASAGSSEKLCLSNPLFKGLKVLVSDDDDVNRAVTKKLLEKLGCQVSSVSSGIECLSALGVGNLFQVVLLDLQMPEMDGFDIAVRIRKFRSGPWPLIVALTASTDDGLWDKCLHTGMNGLIRKPILLQKLSDELCRVLQQAC